MNPGIMRALIVEDDRSWQQLLSEILVDAGMQVEVVDTLDAAVSSLRAVPHRLAVVDLSLSSGDPHDQDGLAVLDVVRRLDPGCATILLSGYATVELAVSALTERGAFTCLRKETFNRTQFRGLIQQALSCLPPTDVSQVQTGAAVVAPSPVSPSPAGDQRLLGSVLVTEDDAGWRNILSELLNDAGYGVRVCHSFGEALGWLRREKYVLAVVDLSLRGLNPAGGLFEGRGQAGYGLDGYQLLTTMRAAGIPAIVVSGVACPADIQRTFDEYGILAFIEKQTFDRGAFLLVVQQAAAGGSSADELDCLTRREREVLVLLAQGLTNREIAVALTVTVNTVKRHLKSIYEKLKVHTRSAAVAKAVGSGVSLD